MTQTDVMKDIERLIGRDRLIAHVRAHPKNIAAGSIFALLEADLLNPGNCEKLIDGETGSFFDIYRVLIRLKAEPNLLTQENFDFLLANRPNSLPIAHGVSYLKIAGLLDQSSFEDVAWR